jgi:hypothetical protein
MRDGAPRACEPGPSPCDSPRGLTRVGGSRSSRTHRKVRATPRRAPSHTRRPSRRRQGAGRIRPDRLTLRRNRRSRRLSGRVRRQWLRLPFVARSASRSGAENHSDSPDTHAPPRESRANSLAHRVVKTSHGRESQRAERPWATTCAKAIIVPHLSAVFLRCAGGSLVRSAQETQGAIVDHPRSRERGTSR